MPQQQHQATYRQHGDGQSIGVEPRQQRNVGEQQPRHKTHRRDGEGAGDQAHHQVKRQVKGIAFLETLQQRQSGGRCEAGAHAQERVLDQIGEQDQSHQRKAESGSRRRGRHQVGSTDAGTGQEDPGSNAASQRR